APDGDPQIVHRGEVALSVLARPWLLWEHHLLVRSVLGAPPADFPLQRAQLPFREVRLRPFLQPLENRLRFQSRRHFQHLLHVRPHRLEWIDPRSIPPPRALSLWRRTLSIPPCRVLAHPTPQRCAFERLSLVQLFHQSPHLLVTDQSRPPFERAHLSRLSFACWVIRRRPTPQF